MQKIITKEIPFRMIIWLARKESGDISPSLTPNSLNLERKNTLFIWTKPTSKSKSKSHNTFYYLLRWRQRISWYISLNFLIFLMDNYMVDVKRTHLTEPCCWKLWEVAKIQHFHPLFSVTAFQFSPTISWQKCWNYMLHKIKFNDSSGVWMFHLTIVYISNV